MQDTLCDEPKGVPFPKSHTSQYRLLHLYWLFEAQENDVTAKLIDIIGQYLLLSALCWATVCLIATIPEALASDTATLEMREWKCWCEVQWKRKPTAQEGSLK